MVSPTPRVPLRIAAAAQLVPERERALRVGIDQQAARALAGKRGNVGGQHALPAATLARGENNDVHFVPAPPSLAMGSGDSSKPTAPYRKERSMLRRAWMGRRALRRRVVYPPSHAM